MESDAAPEDDEAQANGLILDDLTDKFDAFQALRKSDGDAADAILGSLGAQDDVDRDIVLELSAPQPLGHPAQFPAAHRLAVRALEVLDRNGARSVQIKGLGPFNAIAAFLVQQVAYFIVRSHQSRVSDEMLLLYARREANAAKDDPQRRLLMRARMEMERLAPGFTRDALGAPLFVIGGALLSTMLSYLQRALANVFANVWGQIAATVVVGVLMAALAWVVIRGAAVARRRIQLTLDGPITALWETIGRCGVPPRDPSRVFAIVALIFAFLPWLIVPIGIAVSWLIQS